MQSPLSELSLALLRQADANLLDAPLDGLCGRVADPDARELLRALHEAGEGTRLREVLDEDRLARWVEQTCTAREEDALARQLRRWLGAGDAGPDDPERLVRIPAPPAERGALRQWAAQHDGMRALLQPAAAVLADGMDGSPDATIEDVCLGRAGGALRARSLLAEARPAEQASAWLHARVAQQAALTTRAALHRAPLPGGSLGLLARRLRTVFGGATLEALSFFRFVPARRVHVACDSGVCHGAIVTRPGEPAVEVGLLLSGFEQRAVAGRCGTCTTQPCAHVQALAARVYEACLLADDPLHEAVVQLVSVPSWQHFLHALTPAEERRGPGARSEHLAFSLRLDGEQVSVGALLQRTQADGRLSAGKLVSPAKLARSALPTDRDQEVLGALRARTRTLGVQHVPADVALLRALVEHPRVLLEVAGDAPRAPVQLAEERLEVALVEHPDGLVPRVSLAGRVLRAPPRTQAVRYVLHHDPVRRRLSFAVLTPELTRLLTALASFRGVLPPESYPQVAAWVSAIESVARVELPKALEGRAQPPPERLLLRITPRLDEGIDLALSVRALPLAPLWSPGHGPELVHGLLEGTPCTVRRDLARERAQASKVIEALDLRALLELAPFAYRVETTQGALALLDGAARLGALLELEWAERRERLRVTNLVRTADLKVALFKRGDFCALEGGVQQGEVMIAIDRLLEAARTGERFVPIGGGDYAEIAADLLARLADAQLVTVQQARLHTLPTAALPAWLEQLGDRTRAADALTEDLLACVRRAADLARPELVSIDADLDEQLRSYQRDGARWLLSLSRWAPGACLADEMGLGKTIQTIALLRDRAAQGPQLVVAPTSLVDNWLSELARFAPGLSVHAYRGAGRERLLGGLGAQHVLVTSYELLLRDRARFDDVTLSTLVADEAQNLRNARTLRARAALGLRATFRVALSGTPIENRLGDLWSVFQLIAPGLLGSWARFRARFAVPIERYENHERAAALRALIAPFLLRRTKAEVVPELPPRTEVVHLVALSRAERDLYAAALAHARRALGKRSRDQAARTVQILAQLTHLRQLACHPRLVLEDSRVGSSKLSLLCQLLDDLLPRGHRVLVFSQFTRHLALVREALERLGASHCTLDGSTPAQLRKQRVAAFQAGAHQVFLISLKAGGTGLNLTAADYVIHLDPWWNPSSEEQASDRAHRIGQQRPVTVVKLVAQGTIEERVLALHEHKRRLSGSILTQQEPAHGQPDLGELEALLRE